VGEVLAVMIPIFAIAAVMGLGALKVWIQHTEHMEKLRTARQERQAELDSQFLTGSGGTEAHLLVILDRLTAIEARLGSLERGKAAGNATPTPTVVQSGQDACEREQTPRDVNLA
jgi:hypothetical protein